MEIIDSPKIEKLPEEIQKEVIVYSYYDLKAHYEIAEILRHKYGYDYDENDIQLYLQRKMPTDAATSIVLFDELKRGSLIDERTNVALNQVSLYRAETFLRLHDELNQAVHHMHKFVEEHSKEKSDDNNDDDEKSFYDPEIYRTYLESIRVLSRVSADLFKMADPVKIVSTGMKGITREYTLEVAAVISDFIKEIAEGMKQGEDFEEVCVESVKKAGALLNDTTEEFLEKVENLSKNKTLGANF